MLYLYITIAAVVFALGYWAYKAIKKFNQEMAEETRRYEEQQEIRRQEEEAREDRRRRTRVETKKDAVSNAGWFFMILRIFRVEVYFDDEKIAVVEAEWLCAINETAKVTFLSKEEREGWQLQENGWYKYEEEMKVFEVIQNRCLSRLDRLCEEFFEAKLPRRSYDDPEWMPADMR